MTVGWLPSITDTHEFVVPRSIPIIFPISKYFLNFTSFCPSSLTARFCYIKTFAKRQIVTFCHAQGTEAGNECFPLFWHLQNSVPERAFSGTEYACRAKKGFLRYATRFLNPAVLKTGFWGTEGIFGTGNALLRYGTRFQRRKTADSADCGQPSAAPDAFSKARNSRLRYAPP